MESVTLDHFHTLPGKTPPIQQVESKGQILPQRPSGGKRVTKPVSQAMTLW